MNEIKDYLTEEDIEEIYEKFDESVISKIEKENFQKIIAFLKYKKIDFIRDILVYYLDIFTLDINEFILKFQKLEKKSQNRLVEILEYDLSILEEMML